MRRREGKRRGVLPSVRLEADRWTRLRDRRVVVERGRRRRAGWCGRSLGLPLVVLLLSSFFLFVDLEREWEPFLRGWSEWTREKAKRLARVRCVHLEQMRPRIHRRRDERHPDVALFA